MVEGRSSLQSDSRRKQREDGNDEGESEEQDARPFACESSSYCFGIECGPTPCEQEEGGCQENAREVERFGDGEGGRSLKAYCYEERGKGTEAGDWQAVEGGQVGCVVGRRYWLICFRADGEDRAESERDGDGGEGDY